MDNTNTKNKNTKIARIGQYKYNINPIGQGSYSIVYKGYHIIDNYFVAIKKIDYEHSQKMGLKRLKKEIDFLKQLDHPNIAKIYDLYITEKKDIYLITEYCNGRNLNELIKTRKKLEEDEMLSCMIQLRNGFQYLREKKILHRDVKPHNILLHYENVKQLKEHQPVIKLVDFGLATCMKDTYEIFCGTPLYLAPEILLANLKSDLWSIGIVMYEMINGQPPYIKSNSLSKGLYSMKKITLPNHLNVSPELKLLVETLLIKNPRERLSWEDFFNHQWFNTPLKNTPDEVMPSEIMPSEVILNKIVPIEVVESEVVSQEKIDKIAKETAIHEKATKLTDLMLDKITTEVNNKVMNEIINENEMNKKKIKSSIVDNQPEKNEIIQNPVICKDADATLFVDNLENLVIKDYLPPQTNQIQRSSFRNQQPTYSFQNSCRSVIKKSPQILSQLFQKLNYVQNYQ